MPRRCEVIELPGGGFVTVQRWVGPEKDCASCGRTGGILCDFPLRSPTVGAETGELWKGHTCSRSICARCATRVGAGVDWCPAHQRWWLGLAALLGVGMYAHEWAGVGKSGAFVCRR